MERLQLVLIKDMRKSIQSSLTLFLFLYCSNVRLFSANDIEFSCPLISARYICFPLFCPCAFQLMLFFGHLMRSRKSLTCDSFFYCHPVSFYLQRWSTIDAVPFRCFLDGALKNVLVWCDHVYRSHHRADKFICSFLTRAHVIQNFGYL